MKQKNNNIISEILGSISPNEAKKIENKMLLAAKIDDAMKAKGWKKKDLMKAMGKKNPSEVTRWLSGTHNFTVDLLTEIGLALDTDFLNLGTTSLKPIVFHIEIENQPANLPQNNFANEIQKGYSYYREILLTRN
jgi:transcriptional regulator with XRE-family HTH domain